VALGGRREYNRPTLNETGFFCPAAGHLKLIGNKGIVLIVASISTVLNPSQRNGHGISTMSIVDYDSVN